MWNTCRIRTFCPVALFYCTFSGTVLPQDKSIISGVLSNYSWADPHFYFRITGVLGEGQFGTVHQGIWRNENSYILEVAVKTLKAGSEEKDKVKFLQEATIMAQFKHPNVVTLYGVVSTGGPVSLHHYKSHSYCHFFFTVMIFQILFWLDEDCGGIVAKWRSSTTSY